MADRDAADVTLIKSFGKPVLKSSGCGPYAVQAPFMRFLRIEATAGIILLLSTLLALGLANTAWSPSFLAFWEMPAGVRLGDIGIYRSLKHWINDGLMTFFFRHRP